MSSPAAAAPPRSASRSQFSPEWQLFDREPSPGRIDGATDSDTAREEILCRPSLPLGFMLSRGIIHASHHKSFCQFHEQHTKVKVGHTHIHCLLVLQTIHPAARCYHSSSSEFKTQQVHRIHMTWKWNTQTLSTTPQYKDTTATLALRNRLQTSRSDHHHADAATVQSPPTFPSEQVYSFS